jgi:hypothetical protein
MTYGDVTAAEVESGCASAGGTVVSSCPTANELGTCVATIAGIKTTSVYYSGGTMTVVDAELACSILSGTWTAS